MVERSILEKINRVNSTVFNGEYPRISDNTLLSIVARSKENIKSKVYYLDNQSNSIFQINDNFNIDLLTLALKLRGRLLNNIQHLVMKVNYEIKFNSRSIYGFFKGIDIPESHGLLNSQNNLGFYPTEQQITSGIKFFLYDSVDQDIAIERTKVFLQIILSNYKQYDYLLKSLNQDINTILVHAEKSTKKKKRIDLLFRWKTSEDPDTECALAIEAKFGHKVTGGQLASYKDHLTTKLKIPISHRALVLLTIDGQKSKKKDDRGREWKSISWFHLLNKWESKINKDNDKNFTNFRSLIWNKCRG